LEVLFVVLLFTAGHDRNLFWLIVIIFISPTTPQVVLPEYWFKSSSVADGSLCSSKTLLSDQ